MPSASTAVPLKSEDEWTSEWIKRIAGHFYIDGTAFSDVDGTLHIEQTSDGENADVDSSYELEGGEGKGFREPLVGRWWRIRFANGNADQKELRVTAMARRSLTG